MIIMFDLDGTLVTYNDKPRRDIIQMLITLSKYHTVGVWSGGGKDYSEHWVRKLFLEEFVSACYLKPLDGVLLVGNEMVDPHTYVDICFDDELVGLAKINVKV